MSQGEPKSHASRLTSRVSTASWKLRATPPDGAATELFLVDGLTIGRTNANSLQACDDGSGVVERSHARVDFQDDGSIVLKCLSQSASVETGGDTVSALRLDIGSTFRIGLTRFEVVAGATTEQMGAGSVGPWCPYCGKEPTASTCSPSVTECDACGERVVGVPPTSKHGTVGVLPGTFQDTEGTTYFIERFVARGGMGYVLKGRTHEGIAVAIKVLIFDGTSDVQAVTRFKQEISLLRALQDPNVLRLIAHGQQAGLFFYVMEWVEGGDLRSWLPAPGKSRSRIPFSDALRWFEQACMGLHAIHRAGAVHRDIKPSNLLIRDDGQLLIADLGVAKRLNHDETGMTCTGQLTGTYAYMAPEQQYAPDLVDHRTDIYSLGLTFWQLLTGYMYSGVDPQRPSEANDTVPPEFDDVLLSMLKSRIDDRPGAMLDVLRSLPSPATARTGRNNKHGIKGELLAPRSDQIARGVAQVETWLRRCDALVRTAAAFLRPWIKLVVACVANSFAFLWQMLKLVRRTSPLPLGNQRPTPDMEGTAGTSGSSSTRDDGVAAAAASVQASCREMVKEELSGSELHSGQRIPAQWDEVYAVFVYCSLVLIGMGCVLVASRIITSSRQGEPKRPSPSSSVATEPDRPSAAEVKTSSAGNAEAHPRMAVVPFDAAQALTHQREWAAATSNEVKLVNSIGQTFALVPPGSFVMGQVGGDLDEVPHKVTLTKPFFIGVHEVTNAQWKQVMGSVPNEWKGDDLPVEMVSWKDVVEFCRKLSSFPDERRAGRVYRLPTEAEWEYACRAGTPTTFCFGDYFPVLFDYAWFNQNTGFHAHNPNTGTMRVGQKQPNAWGLYDMHGNVWEWCSDWYGSYDSDEVTDPQGPSSSFGRVLRGGAWGSTADNCRSAHRNRYNPSVRYNDLGFRLALNTPEAPEVSPVSSTTQRPAPASRESGEVVENSLGMKLVGIRAGEFEMGSNDGEADEKPAHRVRITKPFLLGQTEVTQGQFERVMGTTPWRDYPSVKSVKDGPTVAANYVNWLDAVEFCRKLTEIERRAGRLPAGNAYRLPTEAEWEYACRAGTKTRFSFGDDESQLGDFAWFDANAVDVGEKYAHEVGRKKANPWGLYDMHGNVWEWCSDWYDEKYYAQSPAADPEGPDAGSFRVIRGGSWDSDSVNCRSGYRLNDTPTGRYGGSGFRVVLSVE